MPLLLPCDPIVPTSAEPTFTEPSPLTTALLAFPSPSCSAETVGGDWSFIEAGYSQVCGLNDADGSA